MGTARRTPDRDASPIIIVTAVRSAPETATRVIQETEGVCDPPPNVPFRGTQSCGEAATGELHGA